MGHHLQTILGRAVALVPALATLWFAAPAAAMPIYLESGGQVVMEAERFTTRGPAVDLPDGTPGGDAEQWLIITSESASSDPFTGARGEFLQVLDAGGIAGEGNFSDPEGVGPFVDYVMNIATTGTYEFFPRWDSPGTQHNSFYLIGGVGSTDFAGDDRFTVNFGFGGRIFATDWLALRLDVRDYLFDMDLFGEGKTTHNLQARMAITIFF